MLYALQCDSHITNYYCADSCGRKFDILLFYVITIFCISAVPFWYCCFWILDKIAICGPVSSEMKTSPVSNLASSRINLSFQCMRLTWVWFWTYITSFWLCVAHLTSIGCVRSWSADNMIDPIFMYLFIDVLYLGFFGMLCFCVNKGICLIIPCLMSTLTPIFWIKALTLLLGCDNPMSLLFEFFATMA